MNIDDVYIEMCVIDTTTSKKMSMEKRICVVKNKTSNSVEVFMKARTEQGIDCKQWFTIQDFDDRFREMKLEDLKFKKHV